MASYEIRDDKQKDTESNKEEYGEKLMSKEQKKQIVASLFGKLLNMHKNVSRIFLVLHVFLIALAIIHIFTLGSVFSETTACYVTWPLSNIFYAFVNYLYCWLFYFNISEISNPQSNNILRVSQRFLKIIFLLSGFPPAFKLLVDHYCRNWSMSWMTIYFQISHIIIETLILTIYFIWFQKKYNGFKLFYKEIIL